MSKRKIWVTFLMLMVVLNLPFSVFGGASKGNEIIIAFTGDTNGKVQPCGWGVKKGGLARRAGQLKELRDRYGEILLLDCGDTFHVRNKNAALRADLIFSAMSTMGYDAVNIGEGELELGVDHLTGLSEKYGIDLISANVSLKQARQKVLPYVIKEIKGVKIAVTGIMPGIFLDEYPEIKKSLHVEKTNKALKSVLNRLEGKADLIILLSHLSYNGTKNLFQYNNPGSISIAISGHGRKLSQAADIWDDTLVVQNSMGGEQLSYLKITTGVTNDIIDTYELVNIALTDQVPENEDIKKKMDEFEKQAGTIAEQERLKKRSSEVLKLSPEAYLKKNKTE